MGGAMTGDGDEEGRKEKKKGGGNVTSAGWQVGLILCDPNPIWHVRSRSGEASR